MLWQDFDDTRKDRNGRRVLSSFFVKIFHEPRELIEQMVDDVRREYPHIDFLGMLTRFLRDRDIERKNSGILRAALLIHDGNLGNISFVDGSNADGAYRNGWLRLLPQELKQGLERAKRGGLDHDPLLVRTQLLLQLGQVRHDLSLDILHLIIWANHHDGSACHDLLQSVTNHLNAQRPFNFFMMDVLGLDTHLPAWGGGEQPSDFGNNGTIQCTKHGLVALLQISIHH
mmetsp:Transcript_33934/g.71409  ORF Transcript_33934/g.71409 Transcript_33934/m.71409 type:complete len:229 (-) Transcript_33934:678-1364(-)